LQDVVRFETEKTLEQRYDARSVYDIFAKSASRHPDRTALTMLMTGADDEMARVVTYKQMLDGVTRAANFFACLGGPGAGVAYIL
ncbi:acyl-CoA synthetase, partial [Acinetobacter baumannii]